MTSSKTMPIILDEEMIPLDMVCRKLRISRRTLSRYLRDKRLIAVRIGRPKYVPVSVMNSIGS